MSLQISLNKSVFGIGLLAVLFVAGCSSSSITRKAPSQRAAQVLERAESLVGTPYCASGITPTCFDCSGFTLYCFSVVEVVLPRTSQTMFSLDTPIEKGALQPGDLVFFQTGGSGVNHVGIMMDDVRFIHASTSKGVMISSLTELYWSVRYVGARRVID